MSRLVKGGRNRLYTDEGNAPLPESPRWRLHYRQNFSGARGTKVRGARFASVEGGNGPFSNLTARWAGRKRSVMAKAKGNAVRKIAPRIERTSGAFRDPRTKSELIDRMMSREFSGDIMDLALNRELRMERTRPNVMQLKFGTSGKTFELVIRKPRGPRTGESLKVKGGKKTGSRTANVRRRRSVDDEGEATGNAVH